MERVSPLNGIALREVVRIGLLAQDAEHHAHLTPQLMQNNGPKGWTREVPRDFLNWCSCEI